MKIGLLVISEHHIVYICRLNEGQLTGTSTSDYTFKTIQFHLVEARMAKVFQEYRSSEYIFFNPKHRNFITGSSESTDCISVVTIVLNFE